MGVVRAGSRVDQDENQDEDLFLAKAKTKAKTAEAAIGFCGGFKEERVFD